MMVIHSFYIHGIVLTAFLISACSTTEPKNSVTLPKTHQGTIIQFLSNSQAVHLPNTSQTVQQIDAPVLAMPVGSQQHFALWLNDHQDPQVLTYQAYLGKYLPTEAVPPMHQLLTTARSWQSCHQQPYQVPPPSLWHNMLPTLRLYDELKKFNILPANTEIRSVYRNPELNACAGGAPASKHLTNGAIDIWVPDIAADSPQLYEIQNKLCHYWLAHGERHAFGLGLYATGAIHLDTQGYRKWGAQFSEPTSVCRHGLPVPLATPAPAVGS